MNPKIMERLAALETAFSGLSEKLDAVLTRLAALEQGWGKESQPKAQAQTQAVKLTSLGLQLKLAERIAREGGFFARVGASVVARVTQRKLEYALRGTPNWAVRYAHLVWDSLPRRWEEWLSQGAFFALGTLLGGFPLIQAGAWGLLAVGAAMGMVTVAAVTNPLAAWWMSR